MSLAIISTHPIQYQAPVYRALQTRYGIPTTAIYGSDFSIAGYHDREFGAHFAWDTDLLSGYTSVFLSRVSKGGASSAETVSARGVLKVLRELKPRAILLLGYRLRFDLRAFWAARQMNVPLLFRAEAADHNRQRSRPKQVTRDVFLRWYYRQFSSVLYIGQSALYHYRRLGVPPERLVFSPYCVDISPFRLLDDERAHLRSEGRASLGIGSDQIVLLMAGKLVHRKGPEYLLQAVKQFVDDLRKQITVLFLGDGELKAHLEQITKHPPHLHACFVGFQNQTTLSQYYHAADLLVMPSVESETWGLVVNEALHHGLPCVVSDRVGCAPDLIKPGVTGDAFQAESVESLAGAIQRALPLIRRPDIQDACRDTISHYTVEQAAEGIAFAYRQSLAHS